MLEALNASVSLTGLIWLGLVMFVIHDLEEIIWIKAIRSKGKAHVLNRIPKPLVSMFDRLLDTTSAQFAVAVLLETLILTVVTFAAAEKGWYLGYLAFMTIFLLHVFTHIGQTILLRMYTPGVVTALLVVFPFTSYTLYRIVASSPVTTHDVLISIPFGFLIVPVVLIGHAIGKKVALP
ncbi:HXXEE domain-containing protein [Saccharibacillus sacchari]|uniref:HXXEE domain-containing protein n=1 Tax=Saccharibacillus sacchari TaxID=456493 RepID=A0ACC6PAV7_9BACL